MNVIANAMEQSLAARGHEIINFVPHSKLERFHSNRLLMRYLRYRHYPAQVRKAASVGADVQHIVDHGYAHLLPGLTSKLRITNAHDLIPLLTWKGNIESKLGLDGRPSPDHSVRKPVLNLHSLKFIRGYDYVVTISESTADDLVEHLGIQRDKISVIPPALSNVFKPASAEKITEFRTKHQLDAQMKWVMLSGREAYKNHSNAFLAIQHLQSISPDKIGVVRAGLPSPEFDALVDHYQMQGRVRNLFLDHDELATLYSTVDCLLFPSLYEGFGMPVAEVLACGTPAVISHRGALPEVAGELAPAFDAFDTEGMAQALSTAISDSTYIEQIKQQGPVAMQRYHPEKIGEQLESLYQRLL